MSKSAKTWGVKEAAHRLAKALNAAGHKAEVREGERADHGWKWECTLVVNDIELPMRHWKLEPNIFVFNSGVSQDSDRVFVSKTGKLDTTHVLEAVEYKRKFIDATAKYDAAKKRFDTILGRYSGVATTDSRAYSKLRVGQPHSARVGGESVGRVNCDLNMELSVDELERVLVVLEEIRVARTDKTDVSDA